jgi:hypothetical protein
MRNDRVENIEHIVNTHPLTFPILPFLELDSVGNHFSVSESEIPSQSYIYYATALYTSSANLEGKNRELELIKSCLMYCWELTGRKLLGRFIKEWPSVHHLLLLLLIVPIVIAFQHAIAVESSANPN